MFKKLLIACAVMAATTAPAFASIESAPYLGASFGVKANTASLSNYDGLIATVFGGYGATVSQTFYLAAELFADIGSLNMSNHTNNSTGVRSSYGFGASILPGLELNDHTTAYMRLGVVRSEFSAASQMATGGQFGLGLQTMLTQNWDLRGEYIYTAYQSVTGVVGNPRSNQFMLGAIYKF